MTNKEALNILNCESLLEVNDAIDEVLFEFKSKFLQQIPPLKVITALKLKIKRIEKACDCLGIEKLRIETNHFLDIKLEQGLVAFLEMYQIEISKIRLEITKSTQSNSLLNCIDQIQNIQKSLFLKLGNYSDFSVNEVDQIPVKLSDQINVFKIQLQLSQTNIDQNKISEYIRTEILTTNFENLSELTKGVINSQKQIVFNEIRR